MKLPAPLQMIEFSFEALRREGINFENIHKNAFEV